MRPLSIGGTVTARSSQRHPLVHGTVWLRQKHPGQRATRPVQRGPATYVLDGDNICHGLAGPRLLRCRPGGEDSSTAKGQAISIRRSFHSLRLRFAPIVTRPGLSWQTETSSKSIAPDLSANHGIRKGCMPRPAAVPSRNSRGSRVPTKHLKTPELKVNTGDQTRCRYTGSRHSRNGG